MKRKPEEEEMGISNAAILGTYEGECADANITNANGLDITRPVWETVFASDESWKDIPGYEGYYQASTSGSIRRVNHNGCIQLKPWMGFGYKVVRLSIHNKSHDEFVHRLVAKTFVPNADNKPQVNHKDGNKLNNAASNLEWVTQSENATHAYKNGLIHMNLAKKRADAQKGCEKIKVKLRCNETGVVFNSISAAARWLNVDTAKLAYASLHNRCVNGLTFCRV